jgi:hypothetical protein
MGNAYQDVDCSTASRERIQAASELSALERKQSGTAAADAVFVALFLVPIGSLTGGDHSGDIATAKGKLNALDARLASCNRASPA